MFLGGFILGIPTVAELVLNGLVFGTTTSALVKDPIILAAGTVPHGGFEIAAYVIAGSVGLRIARLEIDLMRGRDSRVEAKSVGRAVTVVVLFLVIAALIETFVTPELLATVC